MKLSIIIPVYNEEKTLKEALSCVERFNIINNLEREIIIVDDASTDGSKHIIKNLPSSYIVISHSENQGKGASVIDGLKKSTGDIVVVHDADLEYDPENLNDLLKPILDGKADVVYGSRFITYKPHRTLYFWHYMGNRFLTFVSNVFTNLNLTDMETCYKMMTRKVVNDIKDKLTSKRFGIEPEITAYIKKYRVYEVGISYFGRAYGEGKKINYWKDGLSALWCIIKFNVFKK
ncbi:MAG: glycosyltransferase family 2 protein [Candidatus Paceibacterota bacterium]